jgi:hypothetical protein
MNDLDLVLEAIRGAQAKVAFYLESARDHRKGLLELADILESAQLRQALRSLSPGKGNISLVPDANPEEIAPAPPLSR